MYLLNAAIYISNMAFLEGDVLHTSPAYYQLTVDSNNRLEITLLSAN